MKTILIIFAVLGYGLTILFALLVGAYAGEMKARKRRIRIWTNDPDRDGYCTISEVDGK